MNRARPSELSRNVLLAAVVGLSLSIGCSNTPGRIAQPGYARDAGAAAVAAYDQNGDDAIGGDELDRAVAVRSALDRIDHNGDRLVTADEIDARIRAWQDSKIGLLQLAPTVYLDGAPLAQAEVRLVPESFLGSNLQPAVGTTDESGMALLRTEGDDSKVGVQVGLYRIEISKRDGTRETLPARYNTATELGVEVALENAQVARDWKLNLRSKP